jgi:microcystin-dependent protein
MSNCSNCYNGCTEIVSDRCVKYTGIDVPVLGIQTGDSLSFVEQALITFLTSAIDGTGIKPIIDPLIICDLVKAYLPTCGDLSLNDVLTAIVKATCDLQEQIDVIVADIVLINDQLDIIEADYDVKCLIDVTPSITPSSGTHDILQATIDTLCAFILTVETNYVTRADLPILIQAYLDSISNGLYNTRMIPYAVVPYFGPLSVFDSNGAGTGQWLKINLCNGQNGTPDLRGRALTGAIVGVPGNTPGPAVNPANPGNPNYALYDEVGTNQITLLSTQIPLHTHANTISVTDRGHTHGNTTGTLIKSDGTPVYDSGYNNNGTTDTGFADINATITNVAGPVGGGLPHNNIQPVTACYYIQYRP